jgi:hypothetical protein
MNLDLLTIVLLLAAVIIGLGYFARRSARIKRSRRQL